MLHLDHRIPVPDRFAMVKVRHPTGKQLSHSRNMGLREAPSRHDTTKMVQLHWGATW